MVEFNETAVSFLFHFSNGSNIVDYCFTPVKTKVLHLSCTPYKFVGPACQTGSEI